ncbi:MAG: ATP-binding protein [Candidatus Hadarchaeota archaeon]
MNSEIGTVICTSDGPSANRFSFVVTDRGKDIPVRRGQFVELESVDGKVIAQVQNLKKTNRYFMRPDSVKEYEKGEDTLTSIFPADKWEYIVAEATTAGVKSDGGFKQSTFPVSPGDKVYEVGRSVLAELLGIDEGNGVDLGEVRFHNLSARLDLTKLLRKHLAILAMSGAGKSYTASVLIEELLERRKEDGRVASVVVDVHGEYTSFAKSHEDGEDYSDRATVIRGRNIKIGVPSMSAYRFQEFVPDMSGSQVRELNRILGELRSDMRSGKGRYDLDDVISKVKENEDSNKQLRRALLDRLYDLKSLDIFGKSDYPPWEELVNPGRTAILDFSGLYSIRKKRVILTYFARKLFNKRKAGKAPPFNLLLEEAHQFAPSQNSAISSSVLRTVAREGRKFYASLILVSQRPVKLSTTVLSQANTNIILRVTNPYDLDHIKKSSERITKDTVNIISSLPVGQALVVGEAVNHPIFVDVRERKSREPDHETGLEEIAREFEEEHGVEGEDISAIV